MDGRPPVVVGLPTRLRLLDALSVRDGSAVWRARDTHAGHDVAVKLVAASPGVDPELHLARLEREARSLARLRDVPGVVALRELGVAADGTTWLVSELFEGGSLADVADTAPPAGWVAREAPRTAAALAAAHAAAVVHGDLSPSNVLVDADGRTALADFGMAQLLDGDPRGRGVAGCTPAYAAPERLAGAAPDAASDVYALCATWLRVAGATAPGPVATTLQRGVEPDPSRRPTAAVLTTRLVGSI
ncbi:MAG: protein kinase domain-containing protein [Microthrixaceae bacterium]